MAARLATRSISRPNSSPRSITGGPGTGKTFAVRQIVREWRRRNKRVVLACPTARAASVLSDAVGQPASTIHRLLEYNPQEERYRRDHNNRLDADALVGQPDATAAADRAQPLSKLRRAVGGDVLRAVRHARGLALAVLAL